MASPITHNGKFTVKSTRTGEHRTFRVRTQPQDSSFAPGKRVLALLTGPDNENSYTGFAFVDDFGIHLWGKKKTEQYQALANMLERLQAHEDAGRVEVYAETTCRKCNRALTTPESILSGIGPVCGGRDGDTIDPLGGAVDCAPVDPGYRSIRRDMKERKQARNAVADIEGYGTGVDCDGRYTL